MFPHTLLCLALISTITQTFVVAHGSHEIRRREWFQPGDHPVNNLFKRGGDGAQYPEIGSQEWLARFPAGTPGKSPDQSSTPKEWLDALAAAVQAGKIPNIDKSTVPRNSAGAPTGSPVYPNGQDPVGPIICSSTYKCRAPDDVWDAPKGVVGLSFDDGPLPPSSTLVDFLKKNNETATHFIIAVNGVQNPTQFKEVIDYGGDCAVHTWSHPYMTSLSNEDILAELGWTMQLIHDSTGGKVPKIWRPPTGDSDNRVRAIAKEVFGLTTVLWNQDSADWSISTGGQTEEGAKSDIEKWYKGDKGTGIIILEHELTQQTVEIFMATYPQIRNNGWKTNSVARLSGDPYQNVKGDEVTPANVYLSPSGDANTTSSSSSPVDSTTTPITSQITDSATTTPRTTTTRTRTTSSSSTASIGNKNTNTNSALSCTNSSQWFAFVIFASTLISMS